MKVIAVLGSCRKESSSAKIVYEMLRGAEEAGHETLVYKLNDNLKGCKFCGACKNPDFKGFCSQNDVLKDYFENLNDACAVILSAANYMGYPMGEAFTFMNRHYCLHADNRLDGTAKCKIVPGKKFISVFSQGAPDNPGYRANYGAVIKPFSGWGFEVAEPFVVSGAAGGATEELMQKAYEIGKAL